MLAKNGQLSDEQFLDAADRNSELFDLVETTTKGPEARLPEGYIIYDKEGVGRKDVRLQWWNGTASTWRDIAISVPNLTDLWLREYKGFQAIHSECPNLRSRTAATASVVNGGFGPEAASVTKGGKRSSAADANIRTDFRKADVRFTCSDVGSTNGGSAERLCKKSKLPSKLYYSLSFAAGFVAQLDQRGQYPNGFGQN